MNSILDLKESLSQCSDEVDTVVSCQIVSVSSKWELPLLPPSSLKLWRKNRAKKAVLILMKHSHLDRTRQERWESLFLHYLYARSLDSWRQKPSKEIWQTPGWNWEWQLPTSSTSLKVQSPFCYLYFVSKLSRTQCSRNFKVVAYGPDIEFIYHWQKTRKFHKTRK